jgi:hypothetical protein
MKTCSKAMMAAVTALLLVVWVGGDFVKGAKASGGTATVEETPDKSNPEFYEPNLTNRYSGRFRSLDSSYPLDRMQKLCEPFTGVDTAQIKCRRSSGGSFICEYKCSLHWMTTDR